MPYRLALEWKNSAADAEQRNERLARFLLRRFPSLRRVPVDLAAAAYSIDVHPKVILDHWYQIRLDDHTGEFGGAVVTLWLQRVIIGLPARPAEGCEAALQRLAPLLEALTHQELVHDPMPELLARYESQRGRLLHSAQVMEGERSLDRRKRMTLEVGMAARIEGPTAGQLRQHLRFPPPRSPYLILQWDPATYMQAHVMGNAYCVEWGANGHHWFAQLPFEQTSRMFEKFRIHDPTFKTAIHWRHPSRRTKPPARLVAGACVGAGLMMALWSTLH